LKITNEPIQRARLVILSVSLLVLIILIALPSCASPTLSGEGLLIVSHSVYVDSYGFFHVVGEVQNVGDVGTTQNSISVTFYDENGVISATSSGPCYREIIGPSERSPFDLVFVGTPPYANYKLTAQWQATEVQQVEEMAFEEVTSSVNAEGKYSVTGRVLNTGSQAVEYVLVLCTLYDASGRVVAVSYTFADDSPIGVSNSSTFGLFADSTVSSKIYDYVLQSEIG